ncbi:MAG: hypothetical protein A2821_02700 [Candidatus Magasanikbacteria bacterium RIFCSPHIGHO2_01_FULL_41_23]|uniref:GIY-YIG domain-containing protein n=1 Tax=Candidatus Magasanikbacteria bacterium RIFCSPLOWO2_01_FULL_40_15 TaxID=1798686 RepID=A0A1F6N1K6_9BACT|nr:MAG: hypothetical protein A2821_02700 [Candidatus Magasanikbacteria bacterium RIFCSPHIGHO2_01_FULL_41_23]OGH67250.1 MAG: hypothetical protein A3C66_00720 [Candidatus Magasanikbacteria bacterium RIFCSPHIGHO2_02_FULL_41_35]OGH74795.1 MAG: hypothetical protein A3F22_04770 [Candidatus Magasanikbacteria bacterium RIFCSPHIGHO2_12_FULL_41_16]OGH77817.1 MAG: hypothetical protein A2983_00270 [Candidatus Magasanikbacteria bacterium RIFCSPLOWO2_01_FULL_40_15]
MGWFVYYLYSQKLDKYYLGKTNNLARRLDEHNRGSEVYTKLGYPWLLIGYIECNDSIEAAKIERNLKKAKNKIYVRRFIAQHGKIIE